MLGKALPPSPHHGPQAASRSCLSSNPTGKYMQSPTEASGIMISGRDFEFGEVGSVKCSASPLRPELDVGSRS